MGQSASTHDPYDPLTHDPSTHCLLWPTQVLQGPSTRIILLTIKPTNTYVLRR